MTATALFGKRSPTLLDPMPKAMPAIPMMRYVKFYPIQTGEPTVTALAYASVADVHVHGQAQTHAKPIQRAGFEATICVKL